VACAVSDHALYIILINHAIDANSTGVNDRNAVSFAGYVSNQSITDVAVTDHNNLHKVVLRFYSDISIQYNDNTKAQKKQVLFVNIPQKARESAARGRSPTLFF
jgi:hypothetical protein